MKTRSDWTQHLFWILLLLITFAEMLIATPVPQAGIILHAILLAGLLTYSGVARRVEVRNLALALALAPMIRLLSLSLPLPRLPQMAWYPVVSILLMISFWLIARNTGMTRQSLSLRIGKLPLELTLALVGPGLGAIEYLILKPNPQQMDSLAGIALMSLSLLIFTGLVEELIFRGMLQSLAPAVLGRFGLVYVAVLFGVLHIGYLSFADVVFAAVVGLVFAQIVRWGGSLLGVTLAHGMTNITLFLALPALAQQPFVQLDGLLAILITISGFSLTVVGGIFAMQHLVASSSGSPEVAQALRELRELRRTHGLSYIELAQRAEVPVRRLAELELGVVAGHADEISRIAAVLGVAPERLHAAPVLA